MPTPSWWVPDDGYYSGNIDPGVASVRKKKKRKKSTTTVTLTAARLDAGKYVAYNPSTKQLEVANG
jgi:hypothetical protein